MRKGREKELRVLIPRVIRAVGRLSALRKDMRDPEGSVELILALYPRPFTLDRSCGGYNL